jgi:RHS repeat-associated protein
MVVDKVAHALSAVKFQRGVCILAMLALIAPAASWAAGTWQWSASLTVSNPAGGNSSTAYTSQYYPTLQQALAAMRALVPSTANTIVTPSERVLMTAVLQQTAVSQLTPSSVTYSYSPPAVNPVPGAWNYSWNGCNGGPPCLTPNYTTEAAAVASLAGGSCNVNVIGSQQISLTPSGAWVDQYPSNPPYTPYEIFDDRSYSETDVVEQGATPGTCVTEQSSPTLYRARPVSCPTGYETFNGYPTPWCNNVFTGTITGQELLECPTNGSPSTQVGDPCDVSTGDLSQTESDYDGPTLKFQRYYHSATLETSHALGVGWTHNYASYLVLINGNPNGLIRPDGHQDALTESTSVPGAFVSLSGAGIHVMASGSQFIAYLKDGSEEVYSSAGQLQELITATGLITTVTYNANRQLSAVSDAFGHSLQFSYNSNNQIGTVVEPDGSSILYGYDSNNNLTSATYPDSSVRTYQYTNSSFPNNLTGILDEQNQQFLTVNYDPTTAAVTSSYQGGSSLQAQLVSLTYSENGAVVTDALGATHTYTFTNNFGYSPRISSLVVNGQTQSYVVPPPSSDVQQRVTQYTDAKNNVTMYAYDPNHMTSKIEAYETSIVRPTTYSTYQDKLTSLPTLIIEPLRQTAYAYNPGTYQLHTKTVTDTTVMPNVSRTWTYTYTSAGQINTVVGPRTDLLQKTTYAYYTCTTGTQCGEIQTITDPVGKITTFNTYNGHGQPLTITDPNGVVTTLTYDKRQRLLSSEVGTETTTYSYWPTGLLKVVTLPDSSTLTYTYDAAHRLTKITDELGNYVNYTLDAMGNRKAENSYDPSGTLHRTHTRVFNALNELYQDINAAGTAAVTTTYAYDNNHNLTSSDAPLSRNTAEQYDALNRVNQITDPNSGVTKLGYDANDALISVLDPRSLTTSYTNDGFGELTTLVSPDTGSTTNTYDSGGNLKTATDARGTVATYTYDALNRMTQVAYADQTINYVYDQGTDGVGHLTSASDANHSMSWTYNAQGRVTGKGQTVGSVTKSVGYGYTNDDLTSLQTPSGQAVVYGYNSNHQITSITINGTTLLSGATYDPFGPATGWTWGNSTTVSRTYTEDGNPNQIITAGVTNTYTVDNASRITGISDSGLSSNSFTYGYDLLDRVTSGVSSDLNHGYQYDADGNRSTETGTFAYSASITPTNNQIASITGGLARTYSYDAAGNTKSYTGATFTFNDRGRMSSAAVSGGTTNYIYNALGQLVEKSGYEGTTLLVYDEAGHLLGEYSSTGALIQETVWMGDLPVATLRPNGSGITIYYVHADHLGTPRKITNPSNNTVEWRWDPDTYGTAGPAISTISYNQRFPGQYFLPETGLYYNYFRTFDSQTGRYLESDPMGLRGSFSTYSYTNNGPVSRLDPFGLFTLVLDTSISTVDSLPGSRIGSTKATFNNLECVCKGCGTSWTLGACSAFLDIRVSLLWTDDAAQAAFELKSELEHVDDFNAGARSITQAGTSAELAQQRISYTSKQECEASAKNAVSKAINGARRQIEYDSYVNHDKNGNHTYHP